MRIAAVIAAVLGLIAAPAWADDKPPQPGTTVEMPILITPLVVEGRLGGYVYVSSMIVATSPNAAIEVRAKAPFIQDAFVRDVNGASVVKPGVSDANGLDANAVDSDGLTARLLADARRIAGDKKIAGVKLTQVTFAPLRDTSGS